MEWNSPVKFVKGVGERRARALEQMGITTPGELIYHVPRRYLDRSTISPINQLTVGAEATVVGRVTGVKMVRGKRRPYFQLVITDDTGFLTCRWFNGAQWLADRFNKDDVVAVSGKIDFFGGLQISHPDFDILSDDKSNPINTGMIMPLYPSTQALQKVGLDSRGFRRVLKPLMPALKHMVPDPLPEPVQRNYHLLPLADALEQAHFPDSLSHLNAGRDRLKFDELFFMQLLLAIRSSAVVRKTKRNQYEQPGDILDSQYKLLPYDLTDAQKRVVREIWNDLNSPHPMNRLLQGDVGSGKTVVSLLSAAIAAGNGYQTALMAPTEILAEQHYQNAVKFFEGSPIRSVLLTGSHTPAQKKEIYKALKSGYYHLAVGTHALIQGKVEFKNLQLVIIDEQHRFGVVQRGDLIEKAADADVLVMTATPIPRTLSMTIYGDLAVSILDEMPKNRQPIITRRVDVAKLGRVYDFVRQEIQAGHQAFVVYPLIEESEKIDLEAATKGYDHLSTQVFPEFKLALLHGRMSGTEKEAVMSAFAKNEIQILVSTTVIEVGIDIPNATVMLIENAERFGLTQLHQLRGRIGRGTHRSVCVLVQRKPNPESTHRLEIMVKTSDGFKIAEEDLKIRGTGDLFGTRQHGLPNLKLADLVTDAEILREARKAAFEVVDDDPQLRKSHHAGLRHVVLTEFNDLLGFAKIG
ncbi:MAG: ATP-dependent DNA helicase RecG [Candidatus Marinimicrobia bacterium]|nr:ATP-dependent DNA helicase RecG [Candidatus Neomarinimicrobiota bacterium]MCF7840516.1 ATP-dependent DNA helicase RecG [Candidatus Neomarinimicrobiota bacterium]MCF7902238.1 ATP-dependent DNA helicase RecG [Candidatus Neomarinimicrobiota bacterium]